MVRDDDASRTIWLDKTDGALIGMIPDAIAIESSTLTPAWTQQLGEAMLSRGISLLEAPVSGSTPQAESAELIFLVGGEKNALGKAEHLLRAMGSSIQYAGPLGAGAYAKLVTNCLMAVQISTLAEMIGMLRHNDVDPEKVLNAVASTAIWNPHLTRDTDSMLNKDFAPRFPVKLLEKDLAYTLQTAGGDTLAPMTSAVRKLFQTAIGADLGDSHMTAIVKLFENDRHH